jgi:sec-independent protein translocase protein TatC
LKIGGIAGLFSGRPHHPVGPEGRMALSDHFREFRARLLRCLLAMLVVFLVSLVFFDQLYDIVYGPYEAAAERLGDERTMATTSGIGGGLLLYLKLCGFAAVVLTAPYWLYQAWAFVLPGLYDRERKMTRVFVAVAGPLFLAGVALGYFTFPKAIEVLIGFNPDGITNITDFNDYLTFFTRTLLVFGIAMDIPVFVVLLNVAGVLPGRALAAHRPWIIVGTFVFAAVATPSADPFTMTFLAVPMVLLFFVSEVIARTHDRRRAARNPNAGLAPDQLSPL